MKISAIICAAGRGSRAGFQRNKLLVPFQGANALYYTLKAFEGIADEIIITASSADREEIAAIAAPFGAKIAEGGQTRTESVYNALREVTGDMVLIHDGARPFVTKEQIKSVIGCVKEHGSGILAMPSVDTVAIAEDGQISCVPARANVYDIQTPQGFYADDIRAAYERAIKDGGAFTDDGSVYSKYIRPAHICAEGSAANRKLTFKEDFATPFPAVPPVNSGDRAGIGIDVHAFGKAQSFVTLCGVRIPCDTGLIAHSDGDVAVHAVMDAILSAAGLKDIGNYFPDTDDEYRGADSMALLARVIKIISEKGLKVAGLSLAVQAEKPKLMQFTDQMRANLSRITGADKERVSVGAGTSEKLGFVGEKLGICAYCCAVLEDKKN